MTTFTDEELSWLHTLLEGHAEVAADDGDQVEAARLIAMVNDAPVISPADAEWMVEDLQDYDDEPGAISLRAKLAALITAYVFETENDTAIGPFATQDAAEAWITRVIPPEDHRSTDNIAGYRIGTLDEVHDWLSDPQFETPTAAEARYRECYEEFYPNFRFRR